MNISTQARNIKTKTKQTTMNNFQENEKEETGRYRTSEVNHVDINLAFAE